MDIMRFRLRTLMILITAACMYLAWAGYCHRMAVFYRERSSRLMSQVAEQNGWTKERVESAMSDLFERWPDYAAKMSDQRFVDEGQWDILYAKAAAEETAARKYDRAAWRPWTLISN
jgi:hypothetical protein